ncbi:hypothetical protein Tco_0665566 [Tanacetum coccineum]
MEESLSKFMAESVKRHDENSNLIKKIQASTDATIRNQGASIKALEIQIGQIRKVLQERGSGSLLDSTETNQRDHVKSILTIVEAETLSIRRIDLIRYAKRIWTNLKRVLKEKPRMGYQIEASTNMHDSAIPEDSLPPKEKDPGSELAPTKLITELADRTIKCPKGKAENVLVALRERIELDLEGRITGEALIFNRSLDPMYGDYIKLNDLNEPLELRRNQVEDLGLTIEEGEVINEPMDDIVKTWNDNNEINNEIDEYPSFCNFDRKIHIDCAYNLQFSCKIDKIDYKGKNVVGAC